MELISIFFTIDAYFSVCKDMLLTELDGIINFKGLKFWIERLKGKEFF
jgi:hypothetical protein